MIVHVGGSEDRFFVFGSLFDYCGSMCADLGDCDNVQFVNTDTLIKSRALWFLYKAHNSGIANKLFRLPGRSFWYRYLFDNGRIATGGGTTIFSSLTQIPTSTTRRSCSGFGCAFPTRFSPCSL